MCDQQSLRSACAYAQSDQSLCLLLEYTMIVKLLTEHHLEYLTLKGGCRGWSESTHIKMPHCCIPHALALFIAVNSSKHLAYSYRFTYSDVYRHCSGKPRQLRDCVQLGRLKCGQYQHVQICLFRKLPTLGPLSAHQQNAILMVFRWWADSGPLSYAYWTVIW